MYWLENFVAELLSKPISFVHAGALRRTAAFQDDLKDALERRGQAPLFIDWEVAARTGWNQAVEAVSDDAEGSFVILWRPESAEPRRDFTQVLRQARPAVQHLLERGARIATVSFHPRTRFEEPLGSSILDDGPRLSPKLDLAHVPDEAGLGRADLARIGTFAAGSIRLAEAFTAIELADDISGNRKRKLASQRQREVLVEALRELNYSVLASLEHLVCECGLYEFGEEELSNSELAELEAAGLAFVDDAIGRVSLFGPQWRSDATRALELVVLGAVEAPREWERLASRIYKLERLLRQLVVEHLQQVFGERWRVNGLGHSAAQKILGMARVGGHPRPTDIERIHAPLDWMLLDDLLKMGAALSQRAGSVGGLTSVDWLRLQTQIIPVRNRIAHMRLLRQADVHVVAESLRLVEMRSTTR